MESPLFGLRQNKYYDEYVPARRWPVDVVPNALRLQSVRIFERFRHVFCHLPPARALYRSFRDGNGNAVSGRRDVLVNATEKLVRDRDGVRRPDSRRQAHRPFLIKCRRRQNEFGWRFGVPFTNRRRTLAYISSEIFSVTPPPLFLSVPTGSSKLRV